MCYDIAKGMAHLQVQLELVHDTIQDARRYWVRLLQEGSQDLDEVSEEVLAHIGADDIRPKLAFTSFAQQGTSTSTRTHRTISVNPSKKLVTMSSPPGTSHARITDLIVARLSRR